MASFIEFLNDLIEQNLAKINIGMVAKVESFSSETMKADVTPLLKKTNLDEGVPGIGKAYEFPKLTGIPCQFLFAGGYYIRPDYLLGDLVWLSFSKDSVSDQLETGILSAEESKRIFGPENCVVVGGVVPKLFVPPPEFLTESGLLIGHRLGLSYMVFGESNIKVKFGPIITTFDAEGISTTGKISAVQGFETSLGDIKALAGKIEALLGEIKGLDLTALAEVTALDAVAPLNVKLSTHVHASPGSPPTPGT
jgi:hypothetical protein